MFVWNLNLTFFNKRTMEKRCTGYDVMFEGLEKGLVFFTGLELLELIQMFCVAFFKVS